MSDITLTDEELDVLRYEDETDRFTYIKGTEEKVDKRRWYVRTFRVYQHKDTGRLYRFCYDDPATESQEYEACNSSMFEVAPFEVTTVKYLTPSEIEEASS